MSNNAEEKNGLVDFHRTISEQLNARLSESPRFFWAVALSMSAYGYVLWNYKVQDKLSLFVIMSIVGYFSILWATWYLAALGYAFRYLQNAQHRIEDTLGWQIYRPTRTGIPPNEVRRPGELFWLLPGIYHAHLAGLIGISLILHGVFLYQFVDKGAFIVYFLVPMALLFKLGWIIGWNKHYFIKFRREHVPPRR